MRALLYNTHVLFTTALILDTHTPLLPQVCRSLNKMNQRLLLLLLFATSCANGANDVARVMNDTNFEGHNLDHGGCAPVVTSNYTTPALCQHECDNTSGCDMWTFVPAAARHGSVPGPWCCLKSCEIEGGVCPPPNAEQGVVSGVTDPNTYDKCVGPECFTLNVDWSSGNSNPARVLHHPSTANFSVRKLEAFYYPYGCYYSYRNSRTLLGKGV